MFFQDPLTQTFDAIVVGSGATGGWAAKRLSEAGLSVALLEAGRNVSPKEFTEHMPEFKLKYRNMSPEIARTRPIQSNAMRVWGTTTTGSSTTSKIRTARRPGSRLRGSGFVLLAEERWCGAGKATG